MNRRGEGASATLAHGASQGQRLTQYHTTLEATRWDFNVPCRKPMNRTRVNVSMQKTLKDTNIFAKETRPAP